MKMNMGTATNLVKDILFDEPALIEYVDRLATERLGWSPDQETASRIEDGLSTFRTVEADVEAHPLYDAWWEMTTAVWREILSETSLSLRKRED